MGNGCDRHESGDCNGLEMHLETVAWSMSAFVLRLCIWNKLEDATRARGVSLAHIRYRFIGQRFERAVTLHGFFAIFVLHQCRYITQKWASQSSEAQDPFSVVGAAVSTILT